MEIIVLGVVAGLSFLSYSLWKRSRSEGLKDALLEERQQQRLASAEPNLHALRPGDVVTHLTTDYVIEGVLTLDDDGRVTRLYKMADAGRIRWLGVRAGVDEPLFLDEVKGLPIDGSAPDQLTWDGSPYRLSARASARVGLSGSIGERATAERVWLYDYAGVGTRRIVAVGWSDHSAAFAGEPVSRTLLEILPAS